MLISTLVARHAGDEVRLLLIAQREPNRVS